MWVAADAISCLENLFYFHKKLQNIQTLQAQKYQHAHSFLSAHPAKLRLQCGKGDNRRVLLVPACPCQRGCRDISHWVDHGGRGIGWRRLAGVDTRAVQLKGEAVQQLCKRAVHPKHKAVMVVILSVIYNLIFVMIITIQATKK